MNVTVNGKNGAQAFHGVFANAASVAMEQRTYKLTPDAELEASAFDEPNAEVCRPDGLITSKGPFTITVSNVVHMTTMDCREKIVQEGALKPEKGRKKECPSRDEDGGKKKLRLVWTSILPGFNDATDGNGEPLTDDVAAELFRRTREEIRGFKHEAGVVLDLDQLLASYAETRGVSRDNVIWRVVGTFVHQKEVQFAYVVGCDEDALLAEYPTCQSPSETGVVQVSTCGRTGSAWRPRFKAWDITTVAFFLPDDVDALDVDAAIIAEFGDAETTATAIRDFNADVQGENAAEGADVADGAAADEMDEEEDEDRDRR